MRMGCIWLGWTVNGLRNVNYICRCGWNFKYHSMSSPMQHTQPKKRIDKVELRLVDCVFHIYFISLGFVWYKFSLRIIHILVPHHKVWAQTACKLWTQAQYISQMWLKFGKECLSVVFFFGNKEINYSIQLIIFIYEHETLMAKFKSLIAYLWIQWTFQTICNFIIT